MIVRTYLQARQALSLDKVVVATDDARIAKVCRAVGAEVVMTSKDCANGNSQTTSTCRISSRGSCLLMQAMTAEHA